MQFPYIITQFDNVSTITLYILYISNIGRKDIMTLSKSVEYNIIRFNTSKEQLNLFRMTMSVCQDYFPQITCMNVNLRKLILNITIKDVSVNAQCFTHFV